MSHRALMPTLVTLTALTISAAAPAGASTATPAVAAAPAGAAGPTAGSAPAAPSVPGGPHEPRVRLDGELLKTAAEPGVPVQAAVRVGDRLVPIAADPVAEVAPGSQVTVDVTVPTEVQDAADDGQALRVTDGQGQVETHRLDDGDLGDARSATPPDASSDLGAATVDSALAPTGSALAVDEVVSTDESVAAAGDAAAADAPRRLTMISVRPKGAGGSYASASAMRSQAAGADDFWQESSQGEVGISVERVGSSYTSAYTCDQYWQMWDDAADRVGYTPRGNTSLALVLPRSAGCDHGLGSIGDEVTAAGYLYTSGSIADALAHEVGHNMSLEHADSLVCGSVSDAAHSSSRLWRSGCRQHAYGDGQDIMGIDDTSTPSPLLSAPQALRTGMLGSWAAKTVGTGTTTVRLRPLAGHTGQRVARVRNPLTGVTYYVEYRTAAGADRYNSWGQRTGVRVLRVNPSTGETVLLDPTPTGSGGAGDRDPVLRAGSSLRSYDGAVRVTTESTSSEMATVRIEVRDSLSSFSRSSDPRITGSRAVGRTLTADAGSWSPSPSRVSYQWKRNGIRISGATARTYTPTTKDAGRYLSMAVTVHRDGYADATKVSSRVGVPMHDTTRPYVIGGTSPGRTLFARVGAWTPSPTSYAYRWYRDGAAIPGATGRSYVVGSSDVGHRIRVKVVARRSGYSTGTAWSSWTATVRR